MMVRNKPIVLDTGEYILPVYLETGKDTESVGPDSTSGFLILDAKTRKWNEAGVIHSRKGNIQPAVAELAKNHLIAYCRRGGGYGPVADGWTVRSESHDGGRTWAEGTDSKFRNPNSALELLKLRSGSLLMIFNDSMSSRTPLVAALSKDGDRTWPFQRRIAEEPKQSYAYPSAVQTADGLIHVVYTSDSRTVIHHAVFDEEWVQRKP
jgi:predicted neuraminidase